MRASLMDQNAAAYADPPESFHLQQPICIAHISKSPTDRNAGLNRGSEQVQWLMLD